MSTGTARVGEVLGRFPAYLGLADAPVATWVATGLAGDLDVQSAQLLDIRKAHRIGLAATETDLFLLASLHGLGPERVQPLRIRLAAVAALAGQLAAGTIEAATAAQLVTSLLQVPASAQPALSQLGAALAPLLSYSAQVGYFRACLQAVIGLHRAGNGTVSALLGAASAYLGLAPSPAVDSADGYQHVASCTDLLTLAAPAGGAIASDPDVLAVEENPQRPAQLAPAARASGDRFQLLRVGLDTVPVTIQVLGVGDGTVGPMVVNVDAGYGLGYLGTVPAGSELQFTSDGRVTLDAADVGPLGFSFSGAVFANEGELRPEDFVFAHSSGPPGPKDASFAVTAPTADAFDPAPAFPHPELTLVPASAPSGESRWAFFESVGHFGSLVGNQAVPARASRVATWTAARPGRGAPCSHPPARRRPPPRSDSSGSSASCTPCGCGYPPGSRRWTSRRRRRSASSSGSCSTATVPPACRLHPVRHAGMGAGNGRTAPGDRDFRSDGAADRNGALARWHSAALTRSSALRGARPMPLVKPPLVDAQPGQPITAQDWNVLVDGLSALYDAVLALAGSTVSVTVLDPAGNNFASAIVIAVPVRSRSRPGRYPSGRFPPTPVSPPTRSAGLARETGTSS